MVWRPENEGRVRKEMKIRLRKAPRSAICGLAFPPVWVHLDYVVNDVTCGKRQFLRRKRFVIPQRPYGPTYKIERCGGYDVRREGFKGQG
jgi:hypothetical protein